MAESAGDDTPLTPTCAPAPAPAPLALTLPADVPAPLDQLPRPAVFYPLDISAVVDPSGRWPFLPHPLGLVSSNYSSSSCAPTTITLDEHIFTTEHGITHVLSSTDGRIVKLAVPTAHPPLGREPRDFGGVSADGVRLTVACEARAMAALEGMHGEVVPRCFGVYAFADGGEGDVAAEVERESDESGGEQEGGEWDASRASCAEVWASVFDDAVPVSIEDWTEEERAILLSHYKRIHATGVLHNAPRPQNWFRGERGPLVADFRYATVRPEQRSTAQLEAWSRAVKAEILAVRSALGCASDRPAHWAGEDIVFEDGRSVYEP